MEELPLGLNDTLPLLVGIVIFVLLSVIFFRTLKEVPLFEGRAAAGMVAMYTSLLSVMSMFHFLGAGVGPHSVSEKTGSVGANLDFILLPYAALGIAIVLLALYLAGAKLLRNGKPKDSLGHIEDRTASVFQPDPSKGDKPAEGKVGKAHRGRMAIQNNCPGPQPIS